MIVSRAGESVVRTTCGCCGEDLTAHQAVSSGVCDKPRCRDWKIEQAGLALLQRRRQELHDRLFAEAAPAVEAAAAALGGDAAQAVRATLPWQGRKPAPQDPERRAAFEAHLRRIVEEAFAEPIAEEEEPGRDGLEAQEAPVLAAACAVCAGACCDRGGTTAVLDAADIVRWRRRAPAGTPDEAVAAYMAALPGESVAGSCVFLGAAGCALPRAMRAGWCNRFQCRERATLKDAMAGSGAGAALLVAHDAEGDRPGAVGGWSAASGAVHVPLPPAPAGDGEEPAP